MILMNDDKSSFNENQPEDLCDNKINLNSVYQ